MQENSTGNNTRPHGASEHCMGYSTDEQGKVASHKESNLREMMHREYYMMLGIWLKGTMSGT